MLCAEVKFVPPFIKRFVRVVLVLLFFRNALAIPITINLQGSLSDSEGNPLAGTRVYVIQFHDSAEEGNALGPARG